MSEERLCVFIVDDDVSVRESLKPLVEGEGWEARTYPSANAFLVDHAVTGPSCLILDVSLPDLDGLELQTLIADEDPALPIIFITGYGDIPTSVRAMKAGAAEFLTKPFDHDTLLSAVRMALDQSRVAFHEGEALQRLKSRYETLSTREREVLALVVAGLLNKQIAYELGISEITVKAHRGRAVQKMQAKSFAELVNMGTKLGLRQALVP